MQKSFAQVATAQRQLLFKANPMLMSQIALRNFYYPDQHHLHLQQEPHVLVKRIIRCCGDRLRHIDPNRWDGVPITFRTHWNNEQEEYCLRTCVLIHDAVENEFNIEIDDRKIVL